MVSSTPFLVMFRKDTEQTQTSGVCCLLNNLGSRILGSPGWVSRQQLAMLLENRFRIGWAGVSAYEPACQMSDKLKDERTCKKKEWETTQSYTGPQVIPPETRIAFFLQTINFETEELQLQTQESFTIDQPRESCRQRKRMHKSNIGQERCPSISGPSSFERYAASRQESTSSIGVTWPFLCLCNALHAEFSRKDHRTARGTSTKIVGQQSLRCHSFIFRNSSCRMETQNIPK